MLKNFERSNLKKCLVLLQNRVVSYKNMHVIDIRSFVAICSNVSQTPDPQFDWIYHWQYPLWALKILLHKSPTILDLLLIVLICLLITLEYNSFN